MACREYDMGRAMAGASDWMSKMMNDRMRSGAAETIPQATVEHGGCGDDPSLREAVAPTPSTETAL
jgi:hypothetical protein